jgi:DNA-directed RNA polymerase specialized sigma24 family protein
LALTPANVQAAYRDWVDKADGAEGRLYQFVFRMGVKFSRSKMFYSAAFLDLPDDAAQSATIDIWRKLELGHFKGLDSGFFYWVRTICCNHAKDSFAANLDREQQRVPLESPDRDDPSLMSDNPALHRDEPVQYVRRLPDHIQGYDRQICDFIRHGLDYDQIAKTMGLTLDGVKKRIARMKSRNVG